MLNLKFKIKGNKDYLGQKYLGKHVDIQGTIYKISFYDISKNVYYLDRPNGTRLIHKFYVEKDIDISLKGGGWKLIENYDKA